MNLITISFYSIFLLINLPVSVIGQCNNPNKKQCQNGECIDMENWCDGKVECTDGSDETVQSCKNINCPRYAFRCAYGACIMNNLKCNGVKDCHDGSDESPIQCSKVEPNGNCDKFEVQCKSLECISQDKACDGKKDCKDGSDETILTCSHIKCPSYAFQCAYGACVAKESLCNHIDDCADGSDESDCGFITTTTTIRSIFTTTTTTATEPPELELSCTVPTDGFLSMIDTSTDTILRGGSSVMILTSVRYACPRDAVLIGKQSTNFCVGVENWVNKHPRCIKLCPPIIGHTITARCTYKGAGVACDRNVAPGTIAKISCAIMYENPSTQHEDLHCQGDGDWNYAPFKCQQVCGTVDAKIPYSVKGHVTQVNKVPWQVGIYSLDKNNKYEHICGGTLIESRIVITAAHCVWDHSLNRKDDRSKYVVTVGKFYRDYYADEEKVIQKSNLSKIDVDIHFEGSSYDFISDIAVLTLNDHIVYNDHIRPACLTWKTFSEKEMRSNQLGVVSGWGITDTGTFSVELRAVELFSIDNQMCKSRITRKNKISNDKFCVETRDGKNVCKGDSGGGYLVAEDLNNDTYYHLWGIVSNGISTQKGVSTPCDKDFITTFTNIQWYRDLVSNAISDAYSEI